MKTCTTCREQKPLEGFHRRAASPDGRQASCKACQAEYDRAAKAQRVREREDLIAHRQSGTVGWCQHSGCYKPGKAPPNGLGWRFCPEHAEERQNIPGEETP